MRLSGDPCPICSNPIRPLDSMRNLTFHDRAEKAHHRCWYENQDLIAMLEERDRELTLAEAIKRAHAEGL